MAELAGHETSELACGVSGYSSRVGRLGCQTRGVTNRIITNNLLFSAGILDQ